MGPMQRLVYIFEGKDQLTPVARKVSAQLKKVGKEGGKGFSNNLKNGLNTVGPMAASAIGVGLAFAIKKGMEVPMSALKVSLKEAGTSFDQMKPKIGATQDKMEKLGFTNADTDKSLIALLHSTGNVNVALATQATVADLARVKNIGLADASSMLAKAADGNLKALKGLNITTATGKNGAAAMASAEQILGERIDTAGGIAKFAASNHMSVAKAMGLVKAAMGGAQEATAALGDHELTLAQATTLVTKAQNGDSTALAELRKHHLSGYQAQTLVEKATHGNIDAFNQLGITVLPKTATSTQRLAQIQKVLNERIGGTASAAANTFGGKLKVMKAQFTDIAAKIGLKILPLLSKFMTVILKISGSTPLLIAFAGVITLIASAWIGVRIAALLAGTGMKAALISSGVGAAILVIIILITLIITHWKTVKKVALITWNAIKVAAGAVFRWLRGAFATVIDFIMGYFATILHGAAWAFGWIPGLGGKLKTARDKFDQFRKDVNASLRGVNDKTVHVGVAFAAAKSGHQGPVFAFPKASGGAIRGPGGDRADRAGLYALSNNEFVMQASAHKRYGTSTMNAINSGSATVFPGMAAGGTPGLGVRATAPKASTVQNAVMKIVGDMAASFAKNMMGSGSAIVRYARTFMGQVPYVWGGDSTGGWDCSGFISYLYRHFRLMTGRNTAEGFRHWGKKVGSPVPGGMVSFGNPAFHIALTTGGNRTLEAGGGFHTPTWGTTSGGSGFYVPPHGFGRHPSLNTGGLWGNSELGALWARHGGRNKRVAAAIAMAESGGRPSIVQSGMPPGLTGWGLWQITPTSGIWQNARFGNLLNAENNARAAVYLYKQAGSSFRPWSAYNSGAYTRFLANGGPVQRFDRGYGTLRPGYTLAYNGTGRNEHLSAGGGTTVIINARAILGTKREVAKYVSEALQEYKARGGKVP